MGVGIGVAVEADIDRHPVARSWHRSDTEHRFERVNPTESMTQIQLMYFAPTPLFHIRAEFLFELITSAAKREVHQFES